MTDYILTDARGKTTLVQALSELWEECNRLHLVAPINVKVWRRMGPIPWYEGRVYTTWECIESLSWPGDRYRRA